FSYFASDPCTPPSRAPPIPDFTKHKTRATGRRNVPPLPSSITSPFQEIYSSTPPPPPSAQRPRQVSFQQVLCELTDHINDHQKLFDAEEQDFLSHLLLTISSYPDNYIPDAAPLVPTSPAPMPPTSSVSIPEAIEPRLIKQEQTLSHILTR